MKQNLHRVIFGVSLALVSASASAHDFELDDIYYNITNESAKTVEVTYKGDGQEENCYVGGIKIPDTVEFNEVKYKVTAIGENAFSDCEALTTVTIGKNVTIIGANAFSECTGLETITFGSSVKEISEDAFYDCTALTKVSLPSALTKIGDEAFAGCEELATISFPKSLSEIGKGAFESSAWYDDQPSVIYINNMLYIVKNDEYKEQAIDIKEGTTTICNSALRGCNKITSVTIPASVTRIEDDAFVNCTALTTLTIPSTVTYVGERILMNSGIKTFDIPSTFTSISNGMFYNCKSLEKIEIPSGITTIGETAFFNCAGLKDVSISSTVDSIGAMAFSGCTALESITCDAKAVPVLGGSDVFLSVNKSIPVIVPKESLDLYKAADQWKDFTNLMDPAGINDITISKDAGTQKIYTVSGQRISSPAKGIYIREGKKYMMK